MYIIWNFSHLRTFFLHFSFFSQQMKISINISANELCTLLPFLCNEFLHISTSNYTLLDIILFECTHTNGKNCRIFYADSTLYFCWIHDMNRKRKHFVGIFEKFHRYKHQSTDRGKSIKSAHFFLSFIHCKVSSRI